MTRQNIKFSYLLDDRYSNVNLDFSIASKSVRVSSRRLSPSILHFASPLPYDRTCTTLYSLEYSNIHSSILSLVGFEYLTLIITLLYGTAVGSARQALLRGLLGDFRKHPGMLRKLQMIPRGLRL